MANIQIFNSPMFGEIRTTGTCDNPLFCLTDVCKAVSLDPSQVMKRLTDGVVSIHPISDSLGRTQQANFINEDGLYDVILDSRKPQARVFRKWITAEVLPTIRRTGGYIVMDSETSDAEIMARALMVARHTIEQREQRIRQQADTIQEQNRQLAESAEMVQYVQDVLQSPNTYTAQQIAKELDMTVQMFYAEAKRMHILFKQSGRWMLYAKHQGNDYTRTRTFQFTRSDGQSSTSSYTVFTEKGRQFLHQKFGERRAAP